jgi:hypothetical protein
MSFNETQISRHNIFIEVFLIPNTVTALVIRPLVWPDKITDTPTLSVQCSRYSFTPNFLNPLDFTCASLWKWYENTLWSWWYTCPHAWRTVFQRQTSNITHPSSFHFLSLIIRNFLRQPVEYRHTTSWFQSFSWTIKMFLNVFSLKRKKTENKMKT